MAAHFQQPRVALPRDLPDLPDFDQIAQHHRSLATEMAKCSNIPALDGGARILHAIRVLSTEMTTQIREMRGEIRELRGEIREVKMGLRAR
jgi:TolA-binding protein